MRLLVYLMLLAAVGALVAEFPFLWELAVAAAIGGAYWIFFRQPPPRD